MLPDCHHQLILEALGTDPKVKELKDGYTRGLQALQGYSGSGGIVTGLLVDFFNTSAESILPQGFPLTFRNCYCNRDHKVRAGTFRLLLYLLPPACRDIMLGMADMCRAATSAGVDLTPVLGGIMFPQRPGDPALLTYSQICSRL